MGRYTLEASGALERLAPAHRYSYGYGFFTARHPLAGVESRLAGGLHRALSRWPALMPALRRLRESAASSAASSYDVYFEPNFVPMPVAAKRIVVMVHDFAFHHHPEWLPRQRRDYLRAKFASGIRRADLLVTGSSHVREEALDILGLPPERVAVVPEGVDSGRFRPQMVERVESLRRKLALPPRFVLAVGSLEERKNLRRLAEAHGRLPASLRREYPLLLAGPSVDRDLEAELSRRPGVVRLGYVAEADLPALYGAATLFVYPSLYEGFGLPPLEAMACGAPVAASRAAALPEVLGQAAAFFDPLDVEEMSSVVRGLLERGGERRRLSRLGLERAARFTWDETARGLLGVFAGARPAARQGAV